MNSSVIIQGRTREDGRHCLAGFTPACCVLFRCCASFRSFFQFPKHLYSPINYTCWIPKVRDISKFKGTQNISNLTPPRGIKSSLGRPQRWKSSFWVSSCRTDHFLSRSDVTAPIIAPILFKVKLPQIFSCNKHSKEFQHTDEFCLGSYGLLCQSFSRI